MTNAEIFYFVVWIIITISVVMSVMDKEFDLSFFNGCRLVITLIGAVWYGIWGLIILELWLNSLPPLIR